MMGVRTVRQQNLRPLLCIHGTGYEGHSYDRGDLKHFFHEESVGVSGKGSGDEGLTEFE